MPAFLIKAWLTVKSAAGKVVGIAGMILLGVFLAFNWGRSSEKARNEKKAAEVERTAAKRASEASKVAHEKALSAARKTAANDILLDQVAREAEGAQDDRTMSEKILDKIRRLQ